ncbi:MULTISPECIES: class II aldolase/adducin family protein [Streptomyces]|uniref:Class II aldolase/adducin n=1 Tax=Streptomyces albus (strain ATCC 21838 / DSM 41398 / FERM P-419 / JCM 4703 / NBRC 107858) TaxID=1081613 RepID=A0A0B5F408_STRA4|nr:class II aldolase/adducin family protein [Streptomyces sp. SCSIO ZS0520]AJE85042.1 class II aldolase/adducin [Streptomyces albus]AOU79349.1 class II aldolase/adducin [Streptomyces albus]
MHGPTPIPVDQLQFAMPPVHESPEDERRYRKERLAGALRLFGRLGYEDGVSGHLTARDPELTDHYWVNPFGMPFAHLTVSDLVLANHDGQVVEGSRHVNQAAFTVHAEIHRARPEVVAVAHCHSVHGRALAALGEPVDPITQESCAFYEDHALYPDYSGVVVDTEEGRRIAAALGPHKAVVLRNHGLVTVGDSVDAAAWWFLTLERACQVQLAARAAGRPFLIDHARAVATREQLGHDLVAWINYQPMWEQISRSEPDLLA